MTEAKARSFAGKYGLAASANDDDLAGIGQNVVVIPPITYLAELKEIAYVQETVPNSVECSLDEGNYISPVVIRALRKGGFEGINLDYHAPSLQRLIGMMNIVDVQSNEVCV